MSANSLFLVILTASVIGALLLNVASIKWGLKWAGIRDISMAKAVALLLVLWLACLLAGAVLGLITLLATIEPSDRFLDLVGYLGQFVILWVVVAQVYKARLWQAAKAVVPYAVVSVSMMLMAFFVFRPFAYEAFWIPTNSMAPTLLGTHWSATCPKCGHLAYGTPVDSRSFVPLPDVMMMCSKERQPVLISNPPKEIGDGDRILTCKFISAERWDLVVFRYPQDPTVNYVMRLVGLPGEKLEIHDGAVWINGEKLVPPESIAGIRYSPTIEFNGQIYSGPGSVPVVLGPDEYFVLGDFAEQSSDSRFWERGAPGYPPYAVPESHIVGVVINIYWPVSRWTSFR